MALEASAAIARGGNMRTAAVVASLAASGVPVIGPDGIPVAGTGTDSVGVPWWVAETSPYGMDARYSINSLVQLIQQSLPAPKDPLTTEISDLMTKLRAAAVVNFGTSDVQTSFFLTLLADSNRRLGGPELSSNAATAANVVMDQSTATVFLARVMRTDVGAILDTAASPSVSTPPSSSPSVSTPPSSSPPSPLSAINAASAALAVVRAAGHPAADCSPQGTAAYATWVSANIPAAGVTSGAFAELLSGPADLPMNSKAVDGASDIEKIQIVIRILLGTIEGVAAVASVKVTAVWKTGKPLERNQKKAQGNGKEGQAVITVTLAPTKNPKVPECIRDIIQNIVKAGPISKAQVKISGGTGFPGAGASEVFVIFKQPKPDSVTVSSKGRATIAILGKQQSNDAPTPLRPYMRKATLLLTPAATGKPIGDIKSIADAIEFFWRSQISVNLDVKDWGSHYAFFVKWRDQFPPITAPSYWGYYLQWYSQWQVGFYFDTTRRSATQCREYCSPG